MKVSLPSKKVIRAPSGKVITKTDLANKLVKNSRLKSHAFIPGGKLEIINTRYINQFISEGYWLKKVANRNELYVIKSVLKDVEKAKNNEFFTVIAQQNIREKLGFCLPYQVFDKEKLKRKDKYRIGRLVLTLYWLVIPIKSLLRNLRSEKSLDHVVGWEWLNATHSEHVNSLINDFMLLTQSLSIKPGLDQAKDGAQLAHANGDQVIITLSDLTEYEYKRSHGTSAQMKAELNEDLADEPLKKVVELVLGLRNNKVVWLGITDGTAKHVIDLSSLYALTDGLALDLVASAHQKYILDAMYVLPFTPVVNIQLLIEVLTLQLVAQDYAVRLLK